MIKETFVRAALRMAINDPTTTNLDVLVAKLNLYIDNRIEEALKRLDPVKAANDEIIHQMQQGNTCNAR